jgi:hypothetical protein
MEGVIAACPELFAECYEQALAEEQERDDEHEFWHSQRFRNVSTRYPQRVAEAYEHDYASANDDTDEEVAARVAAWERANGLPVTEWPNTT